MILAKLESDRVKAQAKGDKEELENELTEILYTLLTENFTIKDLNKPIVTAVDRVLEEGRLH